MRQKRVMSSCTAISAGGHVPEIYYISIRFCFLSAGNLGETIECYVKTNASPPGSIIPSGRITAIDALRGFAVFGMLMINIRVFSGYAYLDGGPDQQLLLDSWDVTFDRIHAVFFNGKFYTLFALLFGIGFAFQRNNAFKANRPFTRQFARRLFVLLLIGLVHLWAIWFGDILVLYAICGYILMLFMKLPDRKLLWAGLVLMLVPGVYSWYLYASEGGYTNLLFQWLSHSWRITGLPHAFPEKEAFSMQDIATVTREGSLGSLLRFHSLGPILRMYLISVDARLFKILAVFILGFWAGRNIISRQLHQNKAFLVKTAITGWLVGLPLNMFFAMDNITSLHDASIVLIKDILIPFGYMSLTAAYAATFILLYRTKIRKILDALFTAVGKTALSNYIFQSFAGIFLFYGIGLGLGGHVGATSLTVMVFALFGFQVMVSTLWLRRYRMGPLEWLWRVFTYQRRIDNRQPKE